MSTFRTFTVSRKWVAGLLGLTGAAGTAIALSLEKSVVNAMMDADRLAHPMDLPFPHFGPLTSYDVKSIRRGYQVYKNVCSSCHSMTSVAYRMLRNVCMTPEEAKAEAARYTFMDGPNDKGEMYERPGRTSDYLPKPYPNAEAAAYANGGKAPPDLAYITFGKHGEENYIFSLLTGYMDPPAGFQLDEGLHFNPYFKGGSIAMAPPLYNGVIDYHDGTPATKSQCAKDVAAFLRFGAEPWHDDRKKIFLKMLTITVLLVLSSAFYNRVIWTVKKNSKFVYTPNRRR